jgi:hypothetical protein
MADYRGGGGNLLQTNQRLEELATVVDAALRGSNTKTVDTWNGRNG